MFTVDHVFVRENLLGTVTLIRKKSGQVLGEFWGFEDNWRSGKLQLWEKNLWKSQGFVLSISIWGKGRTKFICRHRYAFKQAFTSESSWIWVVSFSIDYFLWSLISLSYVLTPCWSVFPMCLCTLYHELILNWKTPNVRAAFIVEI